MATEPLKHEDPLRDWIAERFRLKYSGGGLFRCFARFALLLLGIASLYGIAMGGFWSGGWSLAVAMKPAGLWITAAICFHRLAG